MISVRLCFCKNPELFVDFLQSISPATVRPLAPGDQRVDVLPVGGAILRRTKALLAYYYCCSGTRSITLKVNSA
jgi:hypothetical protein